MTHRDPIVAEVRKHREAMARKRGSVDAIVAALQRQDASDGTKTVSFPPKRISKRAAHRSARTRRPPKANRVDRGR
jgi:hypothetical protein